MPEGDNQQRLLIPNTTQMPNAMLDEWLAELSGSEWKVVCYIARHTYGFGKEADAISQSQLLKGVVKRDGTILDRGVGLDKKTLLKAITSLEQAGKIHRERRRSAHRGDEPTVYRLILAEPADGPGGESPPPAGEKLRQGGGGARPPGGWGKNSPTQNPGAQNPFRQNQWQTSNTLEEEDLEEGDRRAARPRASKAGLIPLRQILDSRNLSTPTAAIRKRPKPPPASADGGQPIPSIRQAKVATSLASPWIETEVVRISAAFHDSRHLRSNRRQAANLWVQSGLSERAFCGLLGQAFSLTKERVDLGKRSSQHGGVKREMAYFFRVLRDLLSKGSDGQLLYPSTAPVHE